VQTNRSTNARYIGEATRALNDTQLPNDISHDLIASTIAAIEKQLAPIVPLDSVRDLRRERMKCHLRYSSLTALAVSVAIALGVLLLVGDNRAVALDKVLDKFGKAKTVQYTTKEKVGDAPENTMRFIVKGPNARIEFGESTVFMLDTKKRESLMIIPSLKRYVVNGGIASVKSPIDALLSNRLSKTEDLGSQKIDGKEVVKLGLKKEASTKTGEPAQIWVLWVEKKSQLLVKAKCSTYKTISEYGVMKDVVVVSDLDRFIWNENLDDKLFDMTPPAGYKEGLPGLKD